MKKVLSRLDSFVYILLVIIFPIGCASGINVTYLSDPSGARIYQNGTLWGSAPVTLHYEIPPGAKEAGHFSVTPLTARWASGANSTASPNISLNLGQNQQFSFIRPDDTPGREMDVQVAIEQARLMGQIYLQRQQQIQENNRALLQQQQLYQQQQQQNLQNLIQQNNQNLQNQQNRQKNCTSTIYGNQIYTNCY